MPRAGYLGVPARESAGVLNLFPRRGRGKLEEERIERER